MTRYRPTRTVNTSGTGYTETMGNAKTVFCKGFETYQGNLTAIVNERVDIRVGDVLAVAQTIPGGS